MMKSLALLLFPLSLVAQPVVLNSPKPAPEWALWQRHLLKEYWLASTM